MGQHSSFGRICTAATAFLARFSCALGGRIGLMFLAILLLAAPPTLAVEDTGGWENPVVADALEGADLPDLALAKQPPAKRRTYTDKVLGLVGLLLLWGLTRKENARQATIVPKRAHPMTPHELGQALMPIVERQDLNGFRALHLTGPEAAQHMGEEAESYLSSRSRETFLATLRRIQKEIPENATFVDMHIDGELNCALKLKNSDGVQQVPVGQATYLGAVLRLI
jgi:hypothetical protein